jgi:hypothetical protein
MPTKSPGQIAYEEDVRRMPHYSDDTPRRAWDDLPPALRENWERHPTPHDWQIAPPDPRTL